MFSGNPDPIRDLFVLDDNTLFASGGAESTTSYLWKSTDAGATWSSTGPSYYDATLGGLYFLDANTGFFGMYESVFGNINPGAMTWMQTTDGGTTFNPTLISNSPGYWVFSTDFASSTIGFSSRSTYSGIDSVYIKKTVDGGSNWTENTIPNYLGSIYNIDFIDANIGYGVGGTSSNSTVFKTIDGGTTWISESTNTTEMLHSSFFFDENTGIAVGVNGKIIKRQVGNAGINTISSEIASFKIYPNPTYGNSIIEVESKESMKVNVQVISIEGKIIIEHDASLTSGTNILNLNTEELKPGIYLMNIIEEKGSITSGLRLIKQ